MTNNHKLQYGEGRGGSNQEQEYHMQRIFTCKGEELLSCDATWELIDGVNPELKSE